MRTDRPKHSTEKRPVTLFGTTATCALAIEEWPDAVYVVRIAGCEGVYGEGATVGAAVGNLEENLDEFAGEMLRFLGTGQKLSGPIARDWAILDGLFGPMVSPGC